MDRFLDELRSGEIQFRDRWQFELRSDFFPRQQEGSSSYVQEFYFFIPNALQINNETYFKDDFYKNLTNLIRYKTPTISLQALADPKNPQSPLQKLEQDKKDAESLKLFGAMFRSALRNQVQLVLTDPTEPLIEQLCADVQRAIGAFECLESPLKDYVYVREFLSNSTDYFVTELLAHLRSSHSPASELLCPLILEVEKRRHQTHDKEGILYRNGLLKKFVMDIFLLPIERISAKKRFGAWISALSAAIAMTVYLLLFLWQGEHFVINSLPFILLTVLAYVLKDRIKEWLKNLSFQGAAQLFSDYTTTILSPDGKIALGALKESFSFVDPDQLPEDIQAIRQREFHSLLEAIRRPEQVLYFKRSLKLHHPFSPIHHKSTGLNVLLRINVQDFLIKASDPYHTYLSLDPTTLQITTQQLPKVYHLNILLKNQFLDKYGKPFIEHKKFRLIIDKNGIRHVEGLSYA